VAVCYPDTFFDQQPAQDDLKGLVIGGQDIPHLNKILPDVMTHAVPEPWPVKGPWIRLLHALWGETWIPDICLGGRVEMDEESRLQLDHEQITILENLEENNRLIIKGSAGTGKTLLAREAALREARQGKRVLFLCYTDALARVY
jgi:Cdc6-like AAA superfamily ATPase